MANGQKWTHTHICVEYELKPYNVRLSGLDTQIHKHIGCTHTQTHTV